jgi:signal transduction histidine kinase
VNDNAVHIQVQDTGTGIPAEDLPYIFDRFWRGDRARTRVRTRIRTHTHSATSGLGLAIAKQLIQAHNGRISVESTVGKGTIFTIMLPQVQPTTS